MRNTRFQGLARGLNRKRGVMNNTETAFAATLERDQFAGEVVRYWHEPMSLRLSSPPQGQPARYTPDFLVHRSDGECWVIDVKGSGLDDAAAIVRVKAAAELFPLFRFFIAKQRTKKNGGGFEMKEV